MISLVLQHLEALQADLARIDPNHDVDAADKVATMALALKKLVAEDRARQPAPRMKPAAMRRAG